MATEINVARITNIVWVNAENGVVTRNPPTELTVTFPGNTAQQALKSVMAGSYLEIASADVSITPAPAQTDDTLHLHGRTYQPMPKTTAQRAKTVLREGGSGYFRKFSFGVVLYTPDFNPIAAIPRSSKTGQYGQLVTAHLHNGNLRTLCGTNDETNRHVGSGFLSYRDQFDVARYAIEHYFAQEIQAALTRRMEAEQEEEAM